MAKMMRGKVYSCGCCTSKGRNPGCDWRAKDKKEAAVEISDELASLMRVAQERMDACSALFSKIKYLEDSDIEWEDK